MSSETVNITNHTTRILRINLPNVEGRSGLLKIVLMPGVQRVLVTDWKKVHTHLVVVEWLKLGSLRNRTGGFVADRSMISTDRKAAAGNIPKVAITTSAQPQVPAKQLCEMSQTLEQLPQRSGSVERSTQFPSQHVWPTPQSGVQAAVMT